MTGIPSLASLRRGGEAFRSWYEGSLVNRTTLKGQALMAMILLAICGSSYLLVSEQIRRSIEERLDAVATLNAQRIQSEVDQVLTELAQLSRRSLVANGLADSSGSNAYLRPFLHEYRQNIAEIRSLALLDGIGQVIATADPDPFTRTSMIKQVMASGRPAFDLDIDKSGASLHVAYPVYYDASGQTEGVLFANVDIVGLASRGVVLAHTVDKQALMVSLEDARHRTIHRAVEKPFDGELIATAHRLGGVLAEHGLPLTLTVSASRSESYAPLRNLAYGMLGVAVLVTILLSVMMRRMSKTIVSPLAEMSQRAMEIAGAGPLGLRELTVTRSDEIGWMGTAFNEMVFSLRQAYDSQDAEVRRRTVELAEAREQLAGVLAGIDDVVYSADADFAKLEYISPAAARVFGYAPMACLEQPSVLTTMVLSEDTEILNAARAGLVHGVPGDVRYRIRRGDGETRWVQDRFHQVLDDQGSVIRVSGLVRDVTATVEAEASLHLRERALASSSCGVVITDMLQPGQPILYVNDAFEKITGYSAGEVLGRNCSLLQGTEREFQDGLEQIREAIAAGRGCKVVIRNFRKDGQAFWNELQLSPLYDEHGRVTHYIGVQNDISPSIAATQALVDSEQRLALTIDALHEGVWDWQIGENRLITSPSWFGILGITPDAMGGSQTFATFLKHLPETWGARVQDELAAHLEGRASDFYLEHQMLHADGRLIWVANHGRVVERTAAGEPVRMVGTIVDITQRIESSQQIIGLMSQLDSIFTLSPDAFIYLNQAGVVTFVNPAFERLTGIHVGEVSGVTCSEIQRQLLERADPAFHFPSLEEWRPSEEIDGKLMYLQQPARRVLLINRRVGSGNSSVVYIRDVTRETEVDRMKSEFLTTAAHELRTPMASIMGFSELLMLREFTPERTKDMLSTMHRQARRLTDLINELLDLARIEARAGKDFKISRHPLEPVIRDAVAGFHVDGDRSRMRLTLPESLPELEIDPAKMQQAVINLLSNAYKYSPQGGPIDITVARRDKGEAAQIGIIVRDHGIGMSPEQTARVFERFFRADPSGNIPGTGLGMSLVKEIMDSHNGSVEVDSRLGEGTAISLWLPVERGVCQNLPEKTVAPSAHGELTLWLNEPPINAEGARHLH